MTSLEYAQRTTASSVVLAVVGATATMVAASLLIRIGPTEGYRAGYSAVMARGEAWVEREVDDAGGTSLRVCEDLLTATTEFGTQDYGDFVRGCGEGVDDLSGRHVPLLAG